MIVALVAFIVVQHTCMRTRAREKVAPEPGDTVAHEGPQRVPSDWCF